MMLSSEMWRWRWHAQSVSPKIHRSHFQHNLDQIRCTSQRLLRGYWADWQKSSWNKFNGFFTSVVVNGFFPPPLLFKSPLPKRLVAWSRGCRHSAKLIIMISPTLLHSPFGLLTWVPYHFLSQSSPRYDQPPNGNHLAYVATFKNSPHNFLHSLEFTIQCHCTSTWRWSFLWVAQVHTKILPLSFESQGEFQRSEFWENIPLEFNQFSVNSIQFFEIACFQILFLILSFQAWTGSGLMPHKHSTESEKDVGFGLRNMNSSTT